MRLLSPSQYAAVFEPFQGKRIGYVQGWYGNAGDALIHFATLDLFRQFGIEAIVVNPRHGWEGAVPGTVDELVLFGGGNMGYPASARLRRLAQAWPGPKTLLPQSWRALEAAPYDRVFAREHYSVRHCPAAELAPDLGLAFDYVAPIPEPQAEVGVFLRADQESKFEGVRTDPAAGLGRLDASAYLRRAALHRCLVTDRLHFAICGLFNRRRVILLPNGYHKNRGVWEDWLRDLGCEWAETVTQALEAI